MGPCIRFVDAYVYTRMPHARRCHKGNGRGSMRLSFSKAAWRSGDLATSGGDYEAEVRFVCEPRERILSRFDFMKDI